MNEQYPVCDGCGERHPQMSPIDFFKVMLVSVAEEATKVVKDNPGEFPELEQAVEVTNEFADALAAIVAEQGPDAIQSQPTPPTPPESFGLYL